MRSAILLACVLSLVTSLLAIAWAWCAMWQTSAVGAMADQLVIDGYITPAAAEEASRGSKSLGDHLLQGWDRRTFTAGLLLTGAGVISPFVMLAVVRRGNTDRTLPNIAPATAD